MAAAPKSMQHKEGCSLHYYFGAKLVAEQHRNQQERLGGGRTTRQSTTTGAIFTSGDYA